ncbi:HAD family hydrolase [Hydrogenovibrio marinus]|uniref:sucrose-phosphate synthase n=1 Tax=Hydrogenovibrio marinus TaxID=28885 RepID=A0A067A375_HYDMR|nr:HAD family hydrolase [Hydrogenovibrio marinus]KDN96805.1 HAD family hydrolase [Hydrogenovibrio marinus]BBN59062.1 sucrose-phosphate synthase [Hydrogenovibrio marinus]
MSTTRKLYIALISVHGLIRAKNLELGRDADTGGQTLYVLELAQALAKHPAVGRVDLFTRKVVDKEVSKDYAEPCERPEDNFRIIRVEAGPNRYLPKEQLWDHLDAFTDNMMDYFRQQNDYPDILHSHYADGGYVAEHLANQLGIPLIHTGHSLGRVKRRRLLASGLSAQEIETLYNMTRRIDAEENVLAVAERVITSTHQEIEEQYELYDFYQPEKMRVLPPGTNLNNFQPPDGDELDTPLFYELVKHLKEPFRPIILALSRPDRRKNIVALVEAYGQSLKLQSLANLVIIAGNRDDIDDLDQGAQMVFHELLVAIDRYDLYGKVALPKHHKRDQVSLIYRIAAASKGVFVNPALTEPFGLTLIEAAASGLPIVATEDGGPRDIVGNCRNGILIDPLEPKSISDALLRLLSFPELYKSHVLNGLRQVKEHYSWEAHVERYLDVIDSVADSSQRLQAKSMVRSQELFPDRAFVSSLDQNLMDDGEALQQLIGLLRQNRKNTLFIIATGRRLDSALKLMKKHGMPEPDILISSGGTEINYAPKLTMDTAWSRHIDYHWTRYKLKEVLKDYPGLKRQPKEEQSFFKLSYYIDPEVADVEEIKRLLHQEDLSVNVQMSFGKFLDILPIRASKGMALRYVVGQWQIPLERVFVAGGAGSDEDMMRGNPLAAVVANRHAEELSQLVDVSRIYFAKQPYEKGILEALSFYDFFGECRDPREEATVNQVKVLESEGQ